MAHEEIDPSPGVLTPYLRLDEVLHDYAQMVRDVLDRDFVGLYLLGSLAIGDFDLTSDVDFVVVTRDEPSELAVSRLQARHAELIARDDRWVKHLEYSLFPLDELRDLSSPYGEHGRRNDAEARRLWYVNNGSPIVERSDHDNTLVTRWTLRYRSPAVLGPEPSTFAPEIEPDRLREEIRCSMLGWEQLVPTDASLHNRFHQVFLVLNGCRALQDLHEGRITSKREGVAWAKDHLDPRWHALIDHCWQERMDTGIHVSQPADPEAWRQTLEFIEHTTRLAEAYERSD